jgi:hypothetical protein
VAGVEPKQHVGEFRVTADAVMPLGTEVSDHLWGPKAFFTRRISQLYAAHFVPGQKIDVVGTSIGKGFAGVMKRWNFKGGRATHGDDETPTPPVGLPGLIPVLGRLILCCPAGVLGCGVAALLPDLPLSWR